MLEMFRRNEENKEADSEKNWRNGVYLCTVNKTMEADLLESKLRGEGIPCERKYVGSSNYLEIVFGNNLVGEIELYVPEECLEDARNIILPVDLDDCVQEDEEGQRE